MPNKYCFWVNKNCETLTNIVKTAILGGTSKSPTLSGWGAFSPPFLSYALALVMANYILKRKRGNWIDSIRILFIGPCRICVLYFLWYLLFFIQQS